MQAFRIQEAHMFPMLSRLPSFLSPRRCPGTTPPRPVPAASGEPGASADDRPPGCGWFDSTYELSHGLLVCEHGEDTAAGALATLALSDWLDHQLHGWQPPSPAAQA
jgi:hypothetical protein